MEQTSFIPREHGATAMLLIPFFSAAILARQVSWTELGALVAVVCVFAAKDPLLVLARQRWVWKQPHPETLAARRWLLGYGAVAAIILCRWPLAAAVALGFWAFTVAVSLRNRQRSTLFQIAGAFALSATSLVACLAATGRIEIWGWKLWLLSALQATAGILVVHARLDARIALRKGLVVQRIPAMVACAALVVAGLGTAIFGEWWIAAALLLAAAGYGYDLRRQRDPESLGMPLKRTGLEALALSMSYAVLVIGGLW